MSQVGRSLQRTVTRHPTRIGNFRQKSLCPQNPQQVMVEDKEKPDTTVDRQQSLHDYQIDPTADFKTLKYIGSKSLRLVRDEEVLDRLLTMGFEGDAKDMRDLLTEHGPNELPKPELESYFSLWFGQFKDPMMLVLLIAMGVSYGVGDPIAATAIAFILIVATNIGAYTDWSSNKEASKLGNAPNNVVCLINGTIHEDVQEVDLFPGMVLYFSEGDHVVPADCRVLKVNSTTLTSNESMLTGESLPIKKTAQATVKNFNDPQKAQEEREKQVILNKGATISGSCFALVVRTGINTKMGDIMKRIADAEPEPSPLQEMIESLIKTLALLSIVSSVINFTVCAPTGNGTEPDSDDPQVLECLLGSVALTVAAVPENLPVALIIALASIIKKLAKKGVIVKNLVAGENLGKVTMILTDKTGTLTQNSMRVVACILEEKDFDAYYPLQDNFIGPDGETEMKTNDALGVSNLLDIASFQSQTIGANQTDKACQMARTDRECPFELNQFKPFHSKTKMSKGIFYSHDLDGHFAIIKGAPDFILKRCRETAPNKNDMNTFDKSIPIDHAYWEQRIKKWSSKGFRLIALAFKDLRLHDDMGETDIEDESIFANDFLFMGFLAIQDPPREDVKEHITTIKNAGVKVHIVTGDYPETAMSIGEQVGILRRPTQEEMAEGRFLVNATELFRGHSEDEILEMIENLFQYSESHDLALIIGRMKPQHKQYFVKASKNRNEVVAMTGDGSNDGPALSDAHIGIAVGGNDSSELARAAADMILLDGSFVGIVTAIKEGRLGFENILKFLLYLLGTNVSEVIFYLVLTFSDVVIALDALNLLILNLLTDGFPAIALALEDAMGDLMKRRPLSRDTSMMNKFTYVSITITNLTLLISYFAVYLTGLEWHTGDITGTKTDLVEDYDEGLAKARMMIVLVINISQLFLAISHRIPDRSVFSIGVFSGKWMNISAFSSIFLIIFLTHTPGVMSIMRTEYVDTRSYLLVVGMAFLPVMVHELVKFFVFQKLDFNIYKLYGHKVSTRLEAINTVDMDPISVVRPPMEDLDEKI